jgi:hypothetical protein
MRATATAILFGFLMLGYKLDLIFGPKDRYTHEEKKIIGGTVLALMFLTAVFIGFGL